VATRGNGHPARRIATRPLRWLTAFALLPVVLILPALARDSLGADEPTYVGSQRVNLGSSQQVNVQIRLVEVSRNDLQALGFKWEALAGGTQRGVGTGDINVPIEILRRNGALMILKEPTLTAPAGKTTEFLSGGEVPVPAAQPDGRLTVQWTKCGLLLEFTPTIIDTGRFALHVRLKVTTGLDRSVVKGINVPVFLWSQADGIFEMTSGQTVAFAGFIPSLQTEEAAAGLCLDEQFNSERFRRHETEFVILITLTPYLSDAPLSVTP
jgi:pilus assembly protein CpaC